MNFYIRKKIKHIALSGEYVKLLGVYDEYAYVIYKNQVGWIKYEYLKAI